MAVHVVAYGHNTQKITYVHFMLHSHSQSVTTSSVQWVVSMLRTTAFSRSAISHGIKIFFMKRSSSLTKIEFYTIKIFSAKTTEYV